MSLQTYWDLEQGTEEWKRMRMGIITASCLGSLLVTPKDKANVFGAGALTYMNKLMGERMTGRLDGYNWDGTPGWQGNQMERGHEYEPVAANFYLEQKGVTAKKCGFMTNHDIGYSPDLVVEDNGLAEIKTKEAHLQIVVMEADEVPAEHYHQCQGGMWVAEREWIDFISYCKGMPMFVKRMYADPALHAKYKVRVRQFYELMDQRIENLMKMGA